jgi:AcrR family transcriptional regulator
MKSFLYRALEAILEQPATRFDRAAREKRVMAAVIIECALNGYADARMIDIANRAKVSTATLYREYADRDALFITAIETALTLLGQGWRPNTLPDEPVERLKTLLLEHGRAWSDPFLGWIIRMYIIYANTKAPGLLALGKAARVSNMAYWHSQIEALETDGLINKGDTDTKLAIILGAIERRTIFARLAFGENDTHIPVLEDVAIHTAEAFFQVYGTEAFWASQKDEGLSRQSMMSVPEIELPVAKFDSPSDRLREYAQRIMAADFDRLDVAGRQTRVLLAAMLTCMQSGYDAASMADVAETARVSTATLYLDYEDKQKLFTDAMLMQARFRADYNKLIDPALSVPNNIASLVCSIASVLGDPDFLWYHYVAMASEICDAPVLVASSRETRAYTEGFWIDYLNSLVKEGKLQPHDTVLSMNLLLGATQRRSVQSLVLFGKDDVSQDELAQLSVASTAFVLKLYGVG